MHAYKILSYKTTKMDQPHHMQNTNPLKETWKRIKEMNNIFMPIMYILSNTTPTTKNKYTFIQLLTQPTISPSNIPIQLMKLIPGKKKEKERQKTKEKENKWSIQTDSSQQSTQGCTHKTKSC